MDTRLTPRAQQQIEESFENDREAHRLLAVIDAEFRSDPMSVQCFDLRVVKRVRACVEMRQNHIRDGVVTDPPAKILNGDGREY